MGPLAGIKIIEFGAIGPAPFCSMLLADMGAEVLRIDRRGGRTGIANPRMLDRGKFTIEADLKSPEDIALCLNLIQSADVVIEGYRPGVMERLGLGPSTALERNPRLIYGRMTGWGQSGPLAKAAAHDINYIAISGALDCIGPRGGKPIPPLNLVGDLAGGGIYLALGIAAALFETQLSGKGQVIDAAITDGTASLMAFIYGMKADGNWNHERGDNLCDGGAPWYDTYETADHHYVSIGAFEPQFYSELLERLGFDETLLPDRYDKRNWPELKKKLTEVFATKTRTQWCELLEGSETCFAPVLSLDEAPMHPHNIARNTFVATHGEMQPAPAPRFSRTPSELSEGGRASVGTLQNWGISDADIKRLTS